MRSIILISCMSLAMLTACNRDPDDILIGGYLSPPGDIETEGQLYFVEHVMPLIKANCADCHSNSEDDYGAPDFLDVEPNSYYKSLVYEKKFVSCDVENSLLLLKGRDPGHPGGELTKPQHDRVEEWLQREARARFDGKCSNPAASADSSEGNPGEEPAGPLTGLEAIAQFGNCMTLEDWKSTQMHLIANQTALHNQEQTQCYRCHGGGQESNWMPDPLKDEDVVAGFEGMRVPFEIYRLATWTVNIEDGSFKDIVPAYRWRDKGKEASHPQYTLEPQYVESLEKWFSITYEKWEKGNCSLTP